MTSLMQNHIVLEINDAVEFEYEIFKLDEDARGFIQIQDRIIPIPDVTILDWLYWRYFDEDVQLENEDLVLDAEFEII